MAEDELILWLLRASFSPSAVSTNVSCKTKYKTFHERLSNGQFQTLFIPCWQSKQHNLAMGIVQLLR